VTGSVSAEIHAGNGNDTITGGSGDDVIWGGTGNDVIQGGGGNDVLISGSGRSRVSAGAGHNILIGGSLNTTLFNFSYAYLHGIGEAWAQSGNINTADPDGKLTTMLATYLIRAQQARLTGGTGPLTGIAPYSSPTNPGTTSNNSSNWFLGSVADIITNFNATTDVKHQI
jgi:serralysin